MFLDPDRFEFTKRFRAQWAAIAEELARLPDTIIDVHRSGTHAEYFRQIRAANGWAPSWQVGSLEKNFNWLTYGLSFGRQFPAEAEALFPNTRALIQSAPCITAAAFSRMLPLSIIAPHRHPERGPMRPTFHLGIDVEPGKSWLCVGGVMQAEAVNKAIVFDGSAEHFAVNASMRTRTIFYAEFDA